MEGDDERATTATLSTQVRARLRYVERREGTRTVDGTIRELLSAWEAQTGETAEEVYPDDGE